MFNLKQINWVVLCFAALLFTLSFVACGDDDSEEDTCTANFANTTASGIFMGSTFTVVDGMAEEDFADATNFRITLYGADVPGDVCDGFNFDRPAFSIIFSVPMAVGIYQLGLDLGNTVTFNDASVLNEVNADIAICGAVEIVSVSGDQVIGNIDAFANADSDLNGTFMVEFCP